MTIMKYDTMKWYEEEIWNINEEMYGKYVAVM